MQHATSYRTEIADTTKQLQMQQQQQLQLQLQLQHFRLTRNSICSALRFCRCIQGDWYRPDARLSASQGSGDTTEDLYVSHYGLPGTAVAG